MTARKDDIRPRGDRPPAYVDRETGAAELRISPGTWDELVAAGHLPPPIMLGKAGTTPRWRWIDVDARLSGKAETSLECTPRRFFEGIADGQTKDRKRVAS